MARTKSKQSKLDALRAKLEKTDLGGGGGNYFSPKVGKNTIRILPEVGEMEFFFQTVGRHSFPENRYVYCPDFTSEGEYECPVCELVDDLYRAGDGPSKNLASRLRVRKMYWMNVIDRDNEGAGPQVYTPGVTVFGAIVALINDPDYGEIYDIETGVDIVIEREGTGLDTQYQVIPKRHDTPLSDDEELVERWMEDARDLSWAMVSEDPSEDKDLSAGHAIYVQPYDRIVEDFDLDSDLELEDVEDEEDDEDDYVEEEDEDIEEPEENEDDEDDEPEVKKEVTRRRSQRTARRRRR